MSSRSTRGLDIREGQGQVETCAEIMEGVYHICYSQGFWWFEPQNHQMDGFSDICLKTRFEFWWKWGETHDVIMYLVLM